MASEKKELIAPRTEPYGPKDTWVNANGEAIPYSRTTPLERLKEKNAWKLLAAARKAEKALADYRDLHLALHAEVVEAFKRREGADLKEGKGNMEWTDFSRTVMTEAKVQENLRFDGMHITAAREKLDQYMDKVLGNAEESMVVDMVKGAFATRKGQLDPKKVLSLLTYRQRTKSALFHEACDLIEKSIVREYSKTYLTISQRNEAGEMVPVKLNFTQHL